MGASSASSASSSTSGISGNAGAASVTTAMYAPPILVSEAQTATACAAKVTLRLPHRKRRCKIAASSFVLWGSGGVQIKTQPGPLLDQL